MRKENPFENIFACDFETLVYNGQEDTAVWSAAWVELGHENVHIAGSFEEMLFFFSKPARNVTAFFHNLKFDGEFILSVLLRCGYAVAWNETWKDKKELKKGEFTCLISDRGQFYNIIICTGKNAYITIMDSLKLIPFSLYEIGKAFKTEHQKTDMDYYGKKTLQTATEKEKEYIRNDVLVLKEALEVMVNRGHTKPTIGSCCLAEYKSLDSQEYKEYFPNLYEQKLPEGFGAPTQGDYIKKSYGGGWCYRVDSPSGGQIHTGAGFTVDANSLYPSQMHSKSGNAYPIGTGIPFKGLPPEIAQKNYYFIRVRTRFELKPGKLPFLHVRGSRFYRATKCLTTSDFEYNGEYYRYRKDAEGNNVYAICEMTFTCTEWKLVQEHYNLYETEILDGIWFYAANWGIFDRYIDKYYGIKQHAVGAERTLAKLFLNNLYGKFATMTDSDYKVPYLDTDGVVKYKSVVANDKKPGYIACGSAITAYSRNETIRKAQANFYGADKPGFKYADTDSLHCDMPVSRLVGVPVHESALCCWKVESEWEEAVFVRQKTYMEKTGGKWAITCAGMPKCCKDAVIQALETGDLSAGDFSPGLCVYGKLYPHHMRGGIVLEGGYFEMRENL